MTKKLLIILSLIIISFTSLDSQVKKKLRFAADTESGAPYVFQDPENPAKLTGFEYDIILAICQDLGYEPEFVQNQWDGLVPGLSRDDYDVAINGIEITNDRKRVVDFSEPYYITYEQLVVRKNQNDVTTLDDLRGKKVGTLKNSLAEKILQTHGGIIIKSYESEANSYKDLELERLEAVLIDQPVALYYAGWNPQLKLVGQPIGQVVYGIAIKKGREELLENINNAIANLYSSGKLREILESYKMWNYAIALYTKDSKDQNEVNVPPKNYEKFIKSQSKDLTYKDYLDRYISFLPLFGEAAIVTMEISLLSMIVAIILGLFVALVRVYAPRPFSILAITYIEIIRGTPLLIQLFFIYYALPSFGLKISPYFAAVIGLGMNYAAYEAENYRAGLFAVSRGQMEAAISLGMTRNQALRHIIIPQAIRLVIPPVTNDFISLLKDSSLVSVITMVELTKLYNQLSNTYFDYIGTGIIVAVIYLLLGFPFVRLSQYVEKKFSFDKRETEIK
jgi:polar amino acid transport system substrate-binding protein